MEQRNLCDECKSCEDAKNFSLEDCFDICGYPVDILRKVEDERNNQNNERT